MTPLAPTWDTPRAVLFDLDGTLYDQRPLRRAMLRELALAPLRKGPLGALRLARILKAFRVLREDLRALGHGQEVLAELQYEGPADKVGTSAETVRSTVEEWMYRRPLRHLGAAAWPGLRGDLEKLLDAGLKLGVYSDYPPSEKLEALGVGDLFEVKLGATDAEVNAFKPHPRGFQMGAEQLGCAVEDVVYVGDRHELDAAGAAAAGMRSVILETGMDHVGGTSGPLAGAGATAPAARRSEAPAVRSVNVFAEVPHAVGI